MVDNSVKIVSVSNSIKSFSMVDNTRCWHLLYLHSGTITVTLNGSVYVLSPENLLLISPDDFYYIDENGAAHYTVIQFKSSDLYDFGSTNKIYALDTSLVELVNALLSDNDLKQQEFMLPLLLNQCSKIKPSLETLTNEKVRIFSKAVSVMERYVASSVSVDELADMMRVSLSGLKRIFWKYTGIGVHEYYLMLKINKAKELLHSGYSITRTAKVLQFSSQPYFSTTFKRVTGVSAKAFSKGGISVSDKQSNKKAYQNKKRTLSRATSEHQTLPTVETQPASSSTTTTRRSDLPDYLL